MIRKERIKVNRITSPGITPGIKNLSNDMVLTYYEMYDIIQPNNEERRKS